MLIGQWEDLASDQEISYQMIIKEKRLAFQKIPQANLSDKLKIKDEQFFEYKWITSKFFYYGKAPSKDSVRAKYDPPVYTLVRIDKLTDNTLKIALSDDTWEKAELNALFEDGNLDKYIGKRRVTYQKLDLVNNKNRTLLLGLWEDVQSNDSTSFQFFVQKGVWGFLKIAKKDKKEVTTIRPNKGYQYRWLTNNILYYYPDAPVGLTVRSDNPNKYTLMRIDYIDRKELRVTLSRRPFDKAGLAYIKKEDQLHQYFDDYRVAYKRIKIILPPKEKDIAKK